MAHRKAAAGLPLSDISFFLLVHHFRFLPPTNALVDLTFVVACGAAALFFFLLMWPMQRLGRIKLRAIFAFSAV
ncbi:hypothetical protein JWH11_14140 [Xanthomonas melonis]|uniref:Uncharacterized protein n=1 Tax=Xanthomonas melonis TaxID=56456 RepID=A0ABS8NWV4_9XANT|nr:hypothetical protein [Xanthomonas melonis]MCD0258984.1 hypothetical protein [Xanthomonas melonis]MCD0267557.1 hypothetical protein [Xanthomonas melonis]